jgi:hypothetical protein
VSLPLRPLPSRDRPDLKPADDGGSPVVAPKHHEAMVRFLDRTWWLCKVIEWRRDLGGWACHLQWESRGRLLVTSRIQLSRILFGGRMFSGLFIST